MDDTVYGSLTVYRQEVVEELSQYKANHSLEELDAAAEDAIKSVDNWAELETAWVAIKEQISR